MKLAKPRIIFILILPLILLGLILGIYDKPAIVNASEYAKKIIEKCKDSKIAHQRCYDSEVPRLMDRISMENSFKVIQIIQQNDSTYWYCHAAAHALGEREYQKNPALWEILLTRCPIDSCSNGCIHGIITSHFTTSSLNTDQKDDVVSALDRLCEKRENWSPTMEQRSSCYHEIGHISMYVSNANPTESSLICKRVAVKNDGRNFERTCLEGIFMQIFEPREPDDFGLVYGLVPLKDKLTQCNAFEAGLDRGACWQGGWKGETDKFCSQFEIDTKYACLRESWVVYGDQIESREGMVNYCSYSSDADEQEKCFNKLFYILMAKNDFNDKKVLKLCILLPEKTRSSCISGVALILLQTDESLISKGMEICKFAEGLKDEDECYGKIIYFLKTIHKPGSTELIGLCKEMPTKFKTKCSN